MLYSKIPKEGTLGESKNITNYIKDGRAEVKLVDGEGAIRSVTKRRSLETPFNTADASLLCFEPFSIPYSAPLHYRSAETIFTRPFDAMSQ